MNRLKNPKEAKDFRNKLLTKQNGIDPILGISIINAVLDHQHFPPYTCRSALQREVNSFEGKVYNAYKRYIKHLTTKGLPEVLRALAEYLERTYPDAPIHHTAIKNELMPFKKANSNTQNKILKDLGLEPCSNARKRIKQIRTALLGSKITYSELVQKCKDSNE